MQVTLTSSAIKRMKELDKTECCVVVQRGGCFGYRTIFKFDHEGEKISTQDDIDIYLSSEIDVELIVDYQIALIQSSFVVTPVNAKTCCCNRSIKIGDAKIDKKQCLS